MTLDTSVQPDSRLQGLSLLAVLLVTTSTIARAQDPATAGSDSGDASTLPKLADLRAEGLTAEKLLDGEMEDWIVLKDERVARCEPVTPRPDTLEKLQAIRDKPIPQGLPPAEREWAIAARRNARFIEVTLIGGDLTEYQVPVNEVLDVIPHEKRMLWLVDEYLAEGRIREAYDMLQAVERRIPDWEPTMARQNQLLFRDAELTRENGQIEFALAIAEELHSRDAEFDGVSELIGEIIDHMVSRAIEDQDYPQARFFLTRMGRTFPNHPIRQEWVQKIQSQSNSLFARARELFSEQEFAQAADMAREAAHIWPIAATARGSYQEIIRRYQVLRVGVLRLPNTPSSYPLPTDADARFEYLTHAKLFEPVRVTDVTNYDSGFLEEWEPGDLGRKCVFTLRQQRPYWQTQPIVTAADVVDAITDKVDPAGPGYDERLASFVKSYRVLSPYRFEIEFTRVPLRTEALFSFPITRRRLPKPTEAGPDESPSVEIVSKRFVVHSRDDNQIVYRRSQPEPDGMSEYHIARIVERRYDSYDQAVKGLLRGEVDMLPRLKPWDSVDISDGSRFFVQKYTRPVTHVIQFNPRSEVLHNRQLRQALTWGIDREGLLRHVVLRNANGRGGRVVSSPWHDESYAGSTLVRPRTFQIRLAFALTFAARRQFAMQKRDEELAKLSPEELAELRETGKDKEVPDYQLPTMRMVCNPDALARTAAERIVATWKRIGINVELVADDASLGEDQWDLVYRTLRMEEPMIGLWPFLTIEPNARVEALVNYPDWLKRKVIDLDFVSSFRTASELLHALHRQLASGAYFIPLWELDEHLIVRRNVSGFVPEPVLTYQDVEHWIMRN